MERVHQRNINVGVKTCLQITDIHPLESVLHKGENEKEGSQA